MTTNSSRTFEHAFQSFGLNENPFQGSPDPRFFFHGQNYDSTLSQLCLGIEAHGGLLVVTGEPGTGKTLLVRQLLHWLAGKKFSTSFIFHSHLNSAGLFEFILNDFALKADSSKKSEVLATLQKWLESRQIHADSPVVIIDEAQALSVRALNELCLLLNLENSAGKLLQIVLVGQTELEDKLRRPELRQLRQRITVRCRLPVLSLEETEEYVVARLRCAGAVNLRIFPADTIQALYACAQGVPRVVNLLCEKALLAAYAENQMVVTPNIMRRAASEFDFVLEPRSGLPQEIAMPTAAFTPVAANSPSVLPMTSPSVPQIASAFDLQAASSDTKPRPNVTIFAPKPVQADSEPAEVQVANGQPVGVGEEVLNSYVEAGPRPEGGFHRYWREVADSFLRDCRHFLGAFRTQSAPDGKVLFMKKYDLKRDLVAPVSRWLNQPVAFKAGRRHQSKSPQP